MREQRTPGDRMQHLRPRGAHARAFAGGEHDCEAGAFAHGRPLNSPATHIERCIAGTNAPIYGGNGWILLLFQARLIRAELPMTAVRRTQLVRLGVWIGLATLAVLVAVLTARTETGIRRIATL